LGQRNNSAHQKLESLERWSARATLLILLGIIADIALLFWFPHAGTERLAGTAANVVIALGLAIEYVVILRAIIETGKANRESDEKIAEANERAIKADLARVELEAKLAPRSLSKEQFEILGTLAGKVDTICITAMSDFEATRFAAQIKDALIDAGITVIDSDQRIGLVWTELYLVFPSPVENFHSEPLYVTFCAAGLSVGANDRRSVPMGDLPLDMPVIMVGTKKPLGPGYTSAVRVIGTQ
jgi:hypothetical protein